MSDEGVTQTSEKCDPVAVYVFGSLAMLAITLFSMMAVLVGTIFASSEKDHIKSLREATCESYGMQLISDKYHPAMCAFEVDEQGRRVAQDTLELAKPTAEIVTPPVRNTNPF